MYQLAVDLQKPAAQMHGVRVIAEFYYTGPTGPARTFFAARETPLGPCGSPTKSVRVRAGPVGPV